MLESHEPAIEIARRRATGAPYRVRLFDPAVADTPTAESTFDLPAGAIAARTIPAAELERAVFGTEIRKPKLGMPVRGNEIRKALASRKYASTRLLVDVRAPELYHLPWELTPKQAWKLISKDARGSAAAVGPRLIRYTPRLANAALVPLAIPISVLVTGRPRRTSERLDVLDRYFQPVRASRVDPVGLHSLCGSMPFDIVHLRVQARFTEHGEAVLELDDRQAPMLGESQLRAALKRARARLLVLETDDEGRAAAVALGHSVGARLALSVIVASGSQGSFERFYKELTHDLDLVWLLEVASFKHRAVLHVARGGETVMSLTRSAAAIASTIGVEAERVGAAVEGAVELARYRRRPLVEARRNARNVYAELQELTERNYEYSQESRGLVPMTDAVQRFERLGTRARSVVPQARRVVNTWFESDAVALSPRRSLAAAQQYRVCIEIGPRTRRSNVAEAGELPEELLEEQYEQGIVPLRVVLFSHDFHIEQAETVLRLPKPPARSNPVHLAVVAPADPGIARLRICIYHQNNLLQSVGIEAAVESEEVEPHPKGDRGEVEWALSGSFRDLERLDNRDLSILVNETSEGTHVLEVLGAGVREHLELDPAILGTSVEAARNELQKVCSTLKKDGSPDKYRFPRAHRSDAKGLLADLRELAALGWTLYDQLMDSRDDLKQGLGAALAKPRVIQIATVRTARHVFPWSLLYDNPIVPHRGNVLCSEFLSVLARDPSAEELAKAPCLVSGCAHRDDPNVICPSGFWGFRHVIEQPLSTKNTQDGAELGTTDTDVQFEIPYVGQPNALLGLSERLEGCGDHRAEVVALLAPTVDAQTGLIELGDGLRNPDLQLVYFYCHGGRSGGRAWLGVGTKRQPDRIYPANLSAWGIAWPKARPLVFINGCKTVGIRPDDLLDFNRALARCRASGVIGAEIAIPEELGQHVGHAFVTAFRKGGEGAEVGKIIQSIRLDLLARYNPLGLVYTPYCMARLKLVKRRS